MKIESLSAYSKDLNSIEQAFSKIKTILREFGASTYETLLEAMEESLFKVTLAEAAEWFDHCRYQVQVKHLRIPLLESPDARIFATMPPMLAHTLRETRNKQGLSVGQLSKRSGVRGWAIEQIEEGSTSYVPSQGNTALLAEALGLPAGSVLTERDRLVGWLGHRGGQGAGGQGA